MHVSGFYIEALPIKSSIALYMSCILTELKTLDVVEVYICQLFLQKINQKSTQSGSLVIFEMQIIILVDLQPMRTKKYSALWSKIPATKSDTANLIISKL